MIFFPFKNLGLSKTDIESIIEKQLEQNADILIGIDDPEVQELINVIKQAVAIAIEKNNESLKSGIERILKDLKLIS